jgi:hypothetical protein
MVSELFLDCQRQSQILTAEEEERINTCIVIWVVATNSFVAGCQHFGGIFCLHGSDIHLQK